MNYKDIKPFDIENAVGYALLQDILEARKFLTTDEKRQLVIMVSASSVVNENLIGKIHDGVKRLRQIGGVIKDEALAKIEQLATKAQGFADWMANALSSLSTRSLEFFKTKFAKSAKATVLKIQKNDKIIYGKFDTFKKEVDQIKETTSFWLTEFPKQMATNVKTLFSKYLVKESLTESEHGDGHDHPDFGFVSKATDALLKLPPFSLLKNVHDWASFAVEKILFLFSQLTAKLGGPGIFQWTLLPYVVGAFIEVHLEGKIHHFLDHIIEEAFQAEKLLKLLPGVKQILEIIGYVAMFLTIIEVCTELIDWETERLKNDLEPKTDDLVEKPTHDSQGTKQPVNGVAPGGGQLRMS